MASDVLVSHVDPDRVRETLCLGPHNVALTGNVVTITFTHARPKVRTLLTNGTIDVENVVRARIVSTVEQASALRDSINTILMQAAVLQAAILPSKPN